MQNKSKTNMEELKKLRGEINKIDKKIIFLLERRAEIAINTGNFKEKMKIKIEDIKREEEILKFAKSDFAKNVYKKIFKESKKLQKNNSKKQKKL